MTTSTCRSALCLVFFLFAQNGLADDSAITQAKGLFERFQRLEHSFDARVADLYADEARIVSTRKYPFGLPARTIELSGTEYKQLIRKAMGTARARGDFSTYSDVTYISEGERVRVRCTRFSELKNYKSPYSLLVGPTDSGTWIIFEEISETRP